MAAQREFETALSGLTDALQSILAVRGDDDLPLAESFGAEPRLVDRWREELQRVDEELLVWGRTYRKRFGTKPVRNGEEEGDLDEADPYDLELETD